MKAVTVGAQDKSKAQETLWPLKRGDIQLLEFRNNSWRTVAPAGVRPERLDLHSSYWNMLSDEVRVGDDIKVLAHDRSWIARYEIVDAGVGFVAAKLAYFVDCPIRTVGMQTNALPDGWEIVRTEPGEPDGFIAVHREKNKRIDNSGMPFTSSENARTGLLSHAIFQHEAQSRYVP